MASGSELPAHPATAPYTYNLGLAFRHIVRDRGCATALRFPDGKTMTFGELHRLSNRAAHALRQCGVKKGDAVCIFNNKSARAFAAMLACLKLGTPYANLDGTSPPERIARMLETCRPALVLTDGGGDAACGIRSCDLAADDFLRTIERQPADDPEEMAHVTGADAAYIMFTSGSTGFPKGAVMSHANVLNFIGWARATFDISPTDVFTNVNPIYFDNSVFDFYAALFSGAALCPIGGELLREPRELVRAVNALCCTTWFSVPSLLVYLLTMKALGPDDLPAVRRIVFGGEGFPKNKLRELFHLYGSRARLVNVYGPTECTCICSSHQITEEEAENQSRLAPLGQMAPNFACRIDPKSEDRRSGELLIAGPNVGLGYWNDPERTAAAFIQDPFEERFRRIVYRTGDLVRVDEEGLLHFCGRADNQIKYMGYRIELEEIEAAFSGLGYVDEVAVVYRNASGGPGKIVAFVGCAQNRQPPEMLEDLRKKLPPYMIPREVRIMPALPKNANGKIDRARLNSTG